MTLIGAILRKVQSNESIKKYASPPPEIDDKIFNKHKFKKPVKKGPRVNAIVDSSPPIYHEARMYRLLPEWKRRINDIYLDNARIIFAITKANINGGKVDSHWDTMASMREQYYKNREHSYKRINRENKDLYKRIKNTGPRIVPTKDLNINWTRNKHEIIHMAKKPFILFPVCQREIQEDAALDPPEGVHRPRVHITIRIRDAAVIGTLVIELFVDVCPETCRLFLELLDGDGLGHGYVGTQFFRKVPNLYWSGGDVIYNNGFGCYAQRGRVRPITAENYHFSHSTQGLLSMQVTSEGFMCGMFNITFKPLPRFDLRNVVFGRVVRPSPTYEIIRTLGSPLSSFPIIEISATRRKVGNDFISGSDNTKIRFARRF